MQKYKITRAFNGYQVGAVCEFNEADAKRYSAFIIAVKTAVFETKEQLSDTQVKRKGKK